MKHSEEFWWAASVHMSGGLYSKKPVKIFYYKNLDEYYDKTENWGIEKLGLDINPKYNRITFASKDEHEVELWLSGANSVMTILKEWCG